MLQPSNSHGLEPTKRGSEPHRSGRVDSITVAVVAKAFSALAKRVAAAAEAAVASILLWQDVSRQIERLSLLPDSTLKDMGLERSQIVPTVYQAALDRREGDRNGVPPAARRSARSPQA